VAIAGGAGSIAGSRGNDTGNRTDPFIFRIYAKTGEIEINLAVSVIPRRSCTAGVVTDVAVKGKLRIFVLLMPANMVGVLVAGTAISSS
jgi:hypothetical protein